ncbi:J domain-containing protein [Rickettsiella endosymbiont of Dermanyssus gallinae]|uniref:J domain-containing protein n=1 Tax=Rickettsiella endosymbiont of Dermanyssus gallinae TaxID=2856608 RepID=UPI001C52F404|nr:J domain-containing protein [Rickettsiella endosymbiont of Dermanyssus gallinae]
MSEAEQKKKINQSYRLLARRYHPDKGGNTTLFIEIEAAYRTIISPFESEYIPEFNHYFAPTMRQESIVKAMRSRRARDRRALTGEAGNASRRKVICGRHGHELRRSECVPDAGRIAA